MTKSNPKVRRVGEVEEALKAFCQRLRGDFLTTGDLVGLTWDNVHDIISLRLHKELTSLLPKPPKKTK